MKTIFRRLFTDKYYLDMMSTRSGKRIHRSFHENTLQLATELLVKTEKKTRGKRLKENCENKHDHLLTEKRSNYVSYPQNDESEESEAGYNKEGTKKLTTRKAALKEHNEVESKINHVMESEVKPIVRQSRKTKRVVESPVRQELTDENEIQPENVVKPDIKKKKKTKKTNVEVDAAEAAPKSKKKSKKKKNKRSNTLVKEKKLNKSSTSIDSFHSAAGSPVHENVEVENHVEKKETPNNLKLDKTDKKRKSSLKNTTLEKIDSPTVKISTFDTPQVLNTTFEMEDKRKSTRLSNAINNSIQNVSVTKTLDITFDKDDKLTSTDKENKLNSTFDKTNSAKSSLISSDGTINITDDKSNNSRISITSDDSKTENIINTTPLLIESSLDESQIKPDTPNPPVAQLKREGTFTKDAPEVIGSPSKKTPTKHMSLPSPGSTPFHGAKNSQKRSVLNVTRSIEKPTRRSTLVEASTRLTKVMFCSPVDNPVGNTERREREKKIIKSSMKGSNKSFVFDEAASSTTKATSLKHSLTHDSAEDARVKRKRSLTHDSAEDARVKRKRSLTHDSAEDARVKRKRLADDLQLSVDRLSRPRTSSASAKLVEATTPSKKPASVTPLKGKSDAKLSRTKLPNFAALHQRRFEKMESLDECQERKARRAKQLLTPTGAVNIIKKSSPKAPAAEQLKQAKETNKLDIKRGTIAKPKLSTFDSKFAKLPAFETKSSKLPTFESKSSRPGFTRFGFKMNMDVNPFSITKPPEKPKENVPNGVVNGLKRQATLPSLTGVTAMRKEAAKQTIMREKSFTDRRDEKRKETRTTIKGVRTNRRFELQMQMRNIN